MRSRLESVSEPKFSEKILWKRERERGRGNRGGRVPGGGVVLTVTTSLFLEVADLGEGRVLAAGAQQVAEGVELDASSAALVEEGEGFFVVCACLRVLGL